MIKVSIKAVGLSFSKELEVERKRLDGHIKGALNAWGMTAEAEAKRLAPTDESALKQGIKYDQQGYSAELKANAPHSAYIEFGTRKYAASHVSSLPSEFQDLAAQFKGKKGGTFEEMVKNLTEWVRRKGLGSGFGGKIGVTGTYSVKTRRRTGNKAKQADENQQAAYSIARSIMIKGIRPHPYFYPAIQKANKQLKDDLDNI